MVGGAALLVIGVAALVGVTQFMKSPEPSPAATTAAAPPAETPPLASTPTAAPGTAALPPATPEAVPPVTTAPTTPTPPTSPAPSAATSAARTPSGSTTKPGVPPSTAKPAAPTAAAAAAEAAEAAKIAEAERAAKAEAAVRERIDIARAKMASNLLDPAVGDLRQIVAEFPGSAAAAESSFLIAEILEKQGRLDDAMAAHIEFSKRYPADSRMAASQLRLAELTSRSKRPDRETATRDILANVYRTYPKTSQALQALQMRLRIDSERRPRELDPVLGIQVPAAVPTLRAITEQFPTAPGSQSAFLRLAEAYEDLQQFERAAQAWTDLATNFPTNAGEAWFRAGEIYERRLKNVERARDAFAKVPEGSPRYRDAQRKLGRR
jgi:TolA-binding protein